MKLSPSHFSQDLFAQRHMSHSDIDLQTMLDAVGSNSLSALSSEIVPGNIALHTPLELPEALSERDATEALLEMANKNVVGRSAIGMGYFGTITPPVIRRNVLENPAWYTAYTPYQPEISQGRLEALLNYQTMITEICGYDIANASLLDESTAAAEAMAMAHRISTSESNHFYIHEDVLPQTLAVLQTRAEPIGIILVVGDLERSESQEYFGGLISVPGVSGHVLRDDEIQKFAANMAARNAVSIAAVDLLYSCIATPVGHLGVDVAIGTSQRFGVPLGMGGPHAAFIATKSEYSRSLPGRLVGVSTDTEGRPALRLALQTREQHIRREKATSNICTAQVLLANIAGFYGSWHGREGLQSIALRVHSYTSVLRTALLSAGHKVTNDAWFDTLSVIPRSGDAAALVSTVAKDEWYLRHTSSTEVGVSIDETMPLKTSTPLRGSLDALAKSKTCGQPKWSLVSLKFVKMHFSITAHSPTTAPSTKCCATCVT
jgi:glycine dehydrogenase